MDLKDILRLEHETSDRNATFKNHDIRDMAESEARTESSKIKDFFQKVNNYLDMTIYILKAPEEYNSQALNTPGFDKMTFTQRYHLLRPIAETNKSSMQTANP